jgi:hypothetical protein
VCSCAFGSSGIVEEKDRVGKGPVRYESEWCLHMSCKVMYGVWFIVLFRRIGQGATAKAEYSEELETDNNAETVPLNIGEPGEAPL